MHEAIPASPACCQGSRSTVSPTLHISATLANHGGPGQAAGRGFDIDFRVQGAAEIQVDATLETTASQTREIPAEYKTRLALRIAAVTMAICAAVSPPNACCIQRSLGYCPAVGNPTWTIHRAACWRGSTARTSLQQLADTKLKSPTAFGLCPRSCQNPPTLSRLAQRQVVSPQHGGAGCASDVAPVIQQ